DRLARADRAGHLVHRPLVARARPEDPGAHVHRARPQRRAARRGRDEHRAHPRPHREAVIEEVTPDDWDGLVADLGYDDAYLRREYVETSAVLDPGRPTFLRADGEVFPFIVRELDGTRDVTGPYCFGGPVGNSSFYEPYEAWCREHGIVTTFTWFHPRFANHRYSTFHVEPRGRTVPWPPDGELFRNLPPHPRPAA